MASVKETSPPKKASSVKSRRWKRFTHEQIRAKVEQRRDLKCYHTLLMESAVEKDERGIVFDSHHPSWRKLISLVVTQGSENDRRFREELKKRTPDLYTIRQHCRRYGVPPDARGRVWTLLLEEAAVQARVGKPRGDFTKLLPPDDQGLRVIKADVSRTFPYNEMFQRPEVQRELETLLSAYCREYGVQYKQGMNFIFAIFFQLGLPNSRARYHSACLFMETMTGGTFKDSDFGGLQAVFRVFRLLLLYHDPNLCNYLDQYDMVPELYASSWFITLHANRLPVDTLVRLWDALLLDRREDRLLHLFVSLGLLIKRRKGLLNEGVVTLPERLSRLAISSIQEVEELVTEARRKYRPDTPASVRRQLLAIALRPTSVSSPEYQLLESMHCVMVSAEEVVASCYAEKKRRPTSPHTGDGGGAAGAGSPRGAPGTPMAGGTAGGDGGGENFGPVKYFVLDCRPEEEYRSGHLACAYHLDPELLFKPEKLNQAARDLASMRGCHFCLCSDRAPPSRNDSPCTMLVLYLLQKGFKFISRLDGGYAACHEAIARQHKSASPSSLRGEGKHGPSPRQGLPGSSRGRGFEMLVDHDPERCVECLRLDAVRAGRRSGRGPGAGVSGTGVGGGGRRLFGMLQARVSDMLFGLAAPASEESSSLEAARGGDTAGAAAGSLGDSQGAAGLEPAAAAATTRETSATSPRSPPVLAAPRPSKGDFKRSSVARARAKALASATKAGRVRALVAPKASDRRWRGGGDSSSAGLRVLLATLRETKAWNGCLRAALERITSQLVDSAINMLASSSSSSSSSSGGGGVGKLPGGWERSTKAIVVGAVMRERDGPLLERALEAYGRVARGQLARFRPGGSRAKSPAKRAGRHRAEKDDGGETSGGFGDSLPLDIGQGDSSGVGMVLLFKLNASDAQNDLLEAVTDLAARGAQRTCLLAFSLNKTTAGALLEAHPMLHIVTATTLLSDENDSSSAAVELPWIRLERLMAAEKNAFSSPYKS